MKFLATPIALGALGLSTFVSPVVQAQTDSSYTYFAALLMADCWRYVDGTVSKPDTVKSLKLKFKERNTLTNLGLSEEVFTHAHNKGDYEITFIEQALSCSVISQNKNTDDERAYLIKVLDHPASSFSEVSLPKNANRAESIAYHSVKEAMNVLIALRMTENKQMLIASIYKASE